jgi:PKD domain
MRARPRIAALSMIALATIASVLAAPQARSAEPSTRAVSATEARATEARVAAATAGSGRTLYVNAASPRCSDAGAGSRAAPFCAIQAAANAAKPGQVVEIEQSARKRLPFTRSVTFTRSGTPAEPIVFKGMAAGPDGLPVLESKPGVTPVTFRHVHDITIESLAISYGGNVNGVDVNESSDITLNSVILANADRAGKASKSAPFRIDDRSSAITLSRVVFHLGNIPAGSTRAGDTRGQRGAALSESFRLGEPPAGPADIGPAQRQAGIRPSPPRAMNSPPPFGVFLLSPPIGAWCKPVNCWGAPFTYTINWGDGTPTVMVPANTWATHSYKSSGIYLVMITVTDSDGAQQSFVSMAFEW